MKLLLEIPETLHTKIIEGKADKRTMMTVIESGQTLPDDSRLLSESEIINVLSDLKQAQQDSNRIYGIMLSMEAVKKCNEINKEDNYETR